MEQKEQFTTKKKKEIFIEAYRLDNNVSKACKLSKIGRTTFYRWMKQKEFSNKLDEAVESLKDQIENKLISKALEGDNACLIFFCKTRMKDRGYIEKSEQLIEHKGEQIKIIIEEKKPDETSSNLNNTNGGETDGI